VEEKSFTIPGSSKADLYFGSTLVILFGIAAAVSITGAIQARYSILENVHSLFSETLFLAVACTSLFFLGLVLVVSYFEKCHEKTIIDQKGLRRLRDDQVVQEITWEEFGGFKSKAPRVNRELLAPSVVEILNKQGRRVMTFRTSSSFFPSRFANAALAAELVQRTPPGGPIPPVRQGMDPAIKLRICIWIVSSCALAYAAGLVGTAWVISHLVHHRIDNILHLFWTILSLKLGALTA